jgi:hypothetical protein
MMDLVNPPHHRDPSRLITLGMTRALLSLDSSVATI